MHKRFIDLKKTFRSLRNHHFRLFYMGQSVSLVGTWMQQIALSWLVYRMTNSPFLLGMVGFLGQIPTFFLSPIAGVIADRHNRHRMLLMTQCSAMIQAFLLAILILTGKITIEHIFTLSIFLGIITAFDTPIRQSFIIHMIENKEDLGNAIALNSSMVTAARLIGPSIAGILIALWGEGICFLINGLSYLAVILSLFRMKIPPTPAGPKRHVLTELTEGFQYAFNFFPIRMILTLLSLVSLMGISIQTLMPVFAKDIFHGGPETLGFLTGAAGLGSLFGAIYLASRKNPAGLGRIIVVSTVLFSGAMIVLSLSSTLWVSIPLIFLIGLGTIVQLAASNIILQTIVAEDKRGRVMSLYTMAFLGMTPFGSLLAGSLASRIGAAGTVFAAGLSCLTGALFFSQKLPKIREKIRPIYVEKGLLTEVTEGIQ